MRERMELGESVESSTAATQRIVLQHPSREEGPSTSDAPGPCSRSSSTTSAGRGEASELDPISRSRGSGRSRTRRWRRRRRRRRELGEQAGLADARRSEHEHRRAPSPRRACRHAQRSRRTSCSRPTIGVTVSSSRGTSDGGGVGGPCPSPGSKRAARASGSRSVGGDARDADRLRPGPSSRTRPWSWNASP